MTCPIPGFFNYWEDAVLENTSMKEPVTKKDTYIEKTMISALEQKTCQTKKAGSSTSQANANETSIQNRSLLSHDKVLYAMNYSRSTTEEV